MLYDLPDYDAVPNFRAMLLPTNRRAYVRRSLIHLKIAAGASMSTWAERAAQTLLPLSLATTLTAALREWYYTGGFFELEGVEGECELCGQQGLHFHFEIASSATGNGLLVGSECIKRFDLTGIDESGRRIDAAATAKLIDRHRRGLVEDARKRRMMTSLLRLGQADLTFDAHSFLDYVSGRGAFTPNQLAMVFGKLERSGIPYKPKDYKLTIKRDREKSQLRAMSPGAFKLVSKAFSATQRDWISRVSANFARQGQCWRTDIEPG